MRRCGHPSQSAPVDGVGQFGLIVAGLYLNKDDGPSSSRNQIDLATRGFYTPCQYAPALETQPPCRPLLGLPARFFGGAPVVPSHCLSVA